MIMNMMLVRMSRNYKSMLPLGESHCQFISDLICLFWCDLPRLKCLPYLISDNIIFVRLSYIVLIGSARKKEFPKDGIGITAIGANILFIFCFSRIPDIIDASLKALSYRFCFDMMKRYEFCCCHPFPLSFLCTNKAAHIYENTDCSFAYFNISVSLLGSHFKYFSYQKSW